MTQAELTLVAALGSSLLTGLASLGVIWFQERRRQHMTSASERLQAVNAILTLSLSVILRAQALSTLAQSYSSTSTQIGVLFRVNRPLDLPSLFEPMLRDQALLNEAVSRLWMEADQELVRLANEVVVLVADLSAAAMPSPPRGGLIMRVARGGRWRPADPTAFSLVLTRLSTARKELADETRSQFGRSAIDVFAGSPKVNQVR